MKVVVKYFLILSSFYGACLIAEAINDKTVPKTSAQQSAVNPNNVIRLPTTGGCFSLDITGLNHDESSLNNLSIVSVVYDYIEGRTIHLTAMSFKMLRDAINTGDNLFSYAPVPDSVAFLLYVLKKDPDTKKITQHKASNFLDITFLPADNAGCTDASATFQFTHKEIEKAQKAWLQKGGSLRQQAQQKWNSLTPSQKKYIKGALVAVAVIGTALLANLAYKKYAQHKAQMLRQTSEEKIAKAKEAIALGAGIPTNQVSQDSINAYLTPVRDKEL